MKIVISGVTGLRNRGVEALVTTSIEQLQKRLPDLQIVILTDTPDYDLIQLSKYEGIKVLGDSLQAARKGFVDHIKGKISLLYHPVAPEYKTISTANALIVSGGDLFSSKVGKMQLALGFRPIELALKAKTPVIFLGQSTGPFNENDSKKWCDIANQSQLITVRENISYDYLTKTLGLSTNLVKKTSDSAFLLEPPAREYVNKMLNFYGLNKERPKVALAVSQGIQIYSGCDRQKHLQSWSCLIDMIIEKLGAEVLLIPHVQEIWAGIDDRIFATDLMRYIDFRPHVHLIGANHSASELKGIIGSCDLVVAERMHAAIAGLSSGVPTVVVGYSIKGEGIMTDLLGSQSAHNGMLISIDDFLNSDWACQTIKIGWDRRQEVAQQLREILPKIKQEASDNFDLIAKVLNSK